MIKDLKAFCIIHIVILWLILLSANSKNIQNWKQKLIISNNISSIEISKFLNCCVRTFIYIHLSLANLSALFKHKSLSFVNLSLFFHVVCFPMTFVFPRLTRGGFKGGCEGKGQGQDEWCDTLFFENNPLS